MHILRYLWAYCNLILVDSALQHSGEGPSVPQRAISDPLSHQRGRSFSQADDDMEEIQHSVSQKLPEGHKEWHPGMSAQLAASAAHLPPRPSGRKTTGPSRSNAADPFRGSLYSASEDISDDLSVQSARTAPLGNDKSGGSGGRSVEGRHRRGSSDPFRNSQEAETVLSGHSAGVFHEELSQERIQRRSVTEDDIYSVQSSQSQRSQHSRETSNPQRPSHRTIMAAPTRSRSSSRPASRGSTPPTSRSSSRPSSAGGNEPPVYYTTEDVHPGNMTIVHADPLRPVVRILPESASSPGIAARPFDSQEAQLVWSPQGEGGSRDFEDDLQSVQSGRSVHTTESRRQSEQSMMSTPPLPSAGSSARTPSTVQQPTLHTYNRLEPSEPTDVAPLPEEQSVLLGGDSEDDGPSVGRPLEEVGRPLSAYVDINKSYEMARDFGLGHVDEENPMKTPREMLSTAHSRFAPHAEGGDASHLAPMHRRPSPIDQHNIDEFKRGRRSRRASAKSTQL